MQTQIPCEQTAAILAVGSGDLLGGWRVTDIKIMKTKMKKLAGLALIAAPFVVLATITVAEHGWKAAAIVFGISALVVLTIGIGVNLCCD
jgi:hypothetical protein